MSSQNSQKTVDSVLSVSGKNQKAILLPEKVLSKMFSKFAKILRILSSEKFQRPINFEVQVIRNSWIYYFNTAAAQLLVGRQFLSTLKRSISLRPSPPQSLPQLFFAKINVVVPKCHKNALLCIIKIPQKLFRRVTRNSASRDWF